MAINVTSAMTLRTDLLLFVYAILAIRLLDAGMTRSQIHERMHCYLIHTDYRLRHCAWEMQTDSRIYK